MQSSLVKFLTGRTPVADAIRQLARPARHGLRKLGIDVVPITNATAASFRPHLIAQSGVDLVLDVGANAGQYGQMLRGQGYLGDIVSLEPMQKAFAQLQQVAAADPKWRTLHCGAGDVTAEMKINIAGNSYSSSILPMNASHIDALPESAYVGHELIKVRRLDEILKAEALAGRRIYLKIDTQGFEDRVLNGCEGRLADIRLIEMEASFVPLYAGQKLFQDLHAQVTEKGYYITHMEPGFADARTGELLQIDVIYRRRDTLLPQA